MRGARCEVVFLSQSSPSIREMMAFLRALRNIGDVLGSALFFFLNAKIFFILIIFLSEQSENSLANC